MTGAAPAGKREPSLRGKFAGGALESASHILGSASAGIFVAGLVGPYIAALSSPRGMSSMAVLGVSAIALVLSVTAGVGAIILRGLGHCAAHELLGRKSPRHSTATRNPGEAAS